MFRISTTKTLARVTLLFAVLALAGLPGVEAQAHTVNASAGLTAQGAPLALRGYDPVAYFAAAEPRLGKAQFSLAHDGVTYRFASKKNLERFERDPQRYLPQYGGFCAFGVSVGAKFDGDPLVWKIVDGKLYLNLNPEIQRSWNADVEGSVRKADTQWPKIRSASPQDLTPQG